jgi:hypothetical protein
VREQIDKSNSQRKVVVLDCCHSGAFAKAGLGDSVGTEDAFAGSGYGRVILTASDALGLSWEGDEWLGEDRPSVFTNFLVEGLRTGKADLDGDGKIVLDELYKYVYERVMTSGYAKQTPHRWAQKVEGEIFVARNPHPVIKPAELPDELQQTLDGTVLWKREGAVRELARLLQGSDPELALTARETLVRLTNDDSRSISTAAKETLSVYEAAQRSEEGQSEGVPTRESERPTRQETVVSSFAQTLHSLISSTPAWAWAAGGTVLALLVVALFSQGFGLWAEPEPTMTPTETLPAAPTATATVEPTLTSTLPPQPTETPTPMITRTPTPSLACLYQADTFTDTIKQLIYAEAEAVAEEDIAIIQEIFAEDNVVIRDGDRQEEWYNPVEYYQSVFEVITYTNASHFGVQPVRVTETDAWFTSGASGDWTMGGETKAYYKPPGSDHWTFKKIDGCWRIVRFAYNAEDVPFPP